MDNLNKYLETVFPNYPDSPAKDRLRAEAEAKYRVRIDEGMSEAEALGTVIQELDLGDLRQTPDQTPDQARDETPDKVPDQARDETPDKVPDQMSDERFDAEVNASMYGMPRASQEDMRQMASDFRKFQPRFAVGIGLGVVLAIAGIVLAAVMGIYFENPAFSVIAFFAPVAIAVFLFIVFGMRHSAYMSFFRANRMYEHLSADETDRLIRQEFRYKMHPGDEGYKRERRREAISSVLWLITVIVFLLLGFLGDLWHPGWIVFPVAAVIQTLIALL